MLRLLPTLALLLAGPVLPATAQDAPAGVADIRKSATAPAAAVAASIEAAGPEDIAIGMATAELIRAALQDEILLLGRIVGAQARLSEVNALLLASGRDAITLPRHLCPQSPVAPLCADLPATFGSPAP